MADSGPSKSGCNESPVENTSRTQIVCEDESQEQRSPPVLTLRLQAPKEKEEHKVKWSTDTVDNENMGKKKSKCCCIYKKPKVFGESDTSSSEEDDDDCTAHCHGHKKKCYKHVKGSHNHRKDNTEDNPEKES